MILDIIDKADDSLQLSLYDLKMFQRLLLAACVLLTVTSIHGTEWKKEYLRSVRQMAAGDEQEFDCFMAAMSLQESCGASPIEDPNLMNRVISEDLKQVCRTIEPYFECVQRTISSKCAGISNSYVEQIEKLQTVAATVFNYVCIQNVDALNRNKMCLLMQADTAQQSCFHLAQRSGDPFCMINAPLQTCATNIIATGCGQEAANLVGGLAATVRGAAGCPARREVMKKRRGFPFYKTA